MHCVIVINYYRRNNHEKKKENLITLTDYNCTFHRCSFRSGEVLQTFVEAGRLGTACKAEDNRAPFEELLARSGAEVLIEATQ